MAKFICLVSILESILFSNKILKFHKPFKNFKTMWKDYIVRPICDIAAGLLFGALALWIGSKASDGLSVFLVMLFSALGATVMDIIWRMLIAKAWQ